MSRGALLALLLLLAACGGEEAAAPLACLGHVGEDVDGAFATFGAGEDGRARVSYEDGVVLEVPRRPGRIVSTAPGITETVAYLGGLERLVGVTPWCNHPLGVERIAEVTVIPMNVEAVLALEPDLIVADRTLHRSSVDALRRRFEGRLLLLETSRSLAHYETSVALLAFVLHDDSVATPPSSSRPIDRGRRLVGELASVRRRIARAQSRATSAGPRKPPLRVLIVAQWDPLYVEGPGTLMHDLIRICGCVNVACDLDQASGTFSEELVLSRRPDVILYRDGPPPARLRARWGGIPAVRHARLGSVAADAFSRGGPRLVGALGTLHAALAGEVPLGVLEEPE